MIVCHCHGRTDGDIRRAAKGAAVETSDAIGRACGAGTDCGSCRPVIAEILQRLQRSAANRPKS